MHDHVLDQPGSCKLSQALALNPSIEHVCDMATDTAHASGAGCT